MIFWCFALSLLQLDNVADNEHIYHVRYVMHKVDWEFDDDDLFLWYSWPSNTFSLISSRDHCQRSSPSRISHTPRAGFEPAQNLSLGFDKWSCAVVTITTPRRWTHRSFNLRFNLALCYIPLWIRLLLVIRKAKHLFNIAHINLTTVLQHHIMLTKFFGCLTLL